MVAPRNACTRTNPVCWLIPYTQLRIYYTRRLRRGFLPRFRLRVYGGAATRLHTRLVRCGLLHVARFTTRHAVLPTRSRLPGLNCGCRRTDLRLNVCGLPAVYCQLRAVVPQFLRVLRTHFTAHSIDCLVLRTLHPPALLVDIPACRDLRTPRSCWRGLPVDYWFTHLVLRSHAVETTARFTTVCNLVERDS